MKKLLIAVLFFAVLLSAVAPCFAALRRDRGTVRGMVVAVDNQRNLVTVENGGKQMTFHASKGIDPDLSRGNRAIVIYKIGSNEATMVKKIQRRY